MELEKQVCSLELAKRLKELGAKQDGFFVWVENVVGAWNVEVERNSVLPKSQGSYCSAFTVAELGEMLPNYFKHEQRGYLNLVMKKLDDGSSEVIYKERTDTVFGQWAETEADARAKLLIYLIENSLIAPLA